MLAGSTLLTTGGSTLPVPSEVEGLTTGLPVCAGLTLGGAVLVAAAGWVVAAGAVVVSPTADEANNNTKVITDIASILRCANIIKLPYFFTYCIGTYKH